MQRSRLISAATGAATALAIATTVSAQSLDSSVVGAFRWRQVGPSNFMGRLSDVQGIPSPSKTIYVSAAGGGIWKSQNNGQTWKPIFDDKDVISMGMLAIAPSDTNIVWAGTGEPNSLNSGGVGSGLLKSTDGGNTWNEIKGNGYPQGPKGRIGISVARSNPQVVYALTEAASIEPGPVTFQRNPAANGLYRSTDGGA